ncbi:hypothetical protein [Polaromonas sp.]|uniref:hypothetical protein n=1 Tax=Polaromonas sp. TaxID=1869339 RepID=UPI003263F04F
MLRVTSLSFLCALLAACSPTPPSWDTLVSSKITDHYPAYKVLAPEAGHLLVQRPGQMDKAVDVAGIAKFCQRGPADCNYALDQMLLELRGAQ